MADGIAKGLQALTILLVVITVVVTTAIICGVGAIMGRLQANKCRICHQEVNTIYNYVEIGEDLYHLDCYWNNLYIFDDGRTYSWG